MKPTFILLAVLGACIAEGSAQAAEKTVTLSVDNMTCASCPYIVKESLAAIPGVKSVDVFLETQSAVVTFEDTETSEEVMTKATTDAGYPSQVKS